MRILNRKQLASIPMVDQGNLYLGEVSDATEVIRDRLGREQAARIRVAQIRRANLQAQAARAAANRERANLGHAEMLQRSLKQTGHKTAYAARRQGTGYEKQFGMVNPTMGFVDGEDTVLADFESRETYNAQEFNNRLTNHDSKLYTKFKDYPLVVDAPKGDFGGILTNEAGSADFSEWIVDDARTDFGYVPRRAPARRRR